MRESTMWASATGRPFRHQSSDPSPKFHSSDRRGPSPQSLQEGLRADGNLAWLLSIVQAPLVLSSCRSHGS